MQVQKYSGKPLLYDLAWCTSNYHFGISIWGFLHMFCIRSCKNIARMGGGGVIDHSPPPPPNPATSTQAGVCFALLDIRAFWFNEARYSCRNPFNRQACQFNWQGIECDLVSYLDGRIQRVEVHPTLSLEFATCSVSAKAFLLLVFYSKFYICFRLFQEHPKIE